MYFLSIDPGASGAIAIFHDQELLTVFDIPFRKAGSHKVMDFDKCNLLIEDFAPLDEIERIYIEEVSSRTGQGVKSMFSFGERFGEVKLYGLTLTDDLVFLPPQSWKRSAGLIGTDKIESAKRATKIYPNQSNLFVEENKRCKGGVKYYDGRGDAVLLGLIGFKKEK